MADCHLAYAADCWRAWALWQTDEHTPDYTFRDDNLALNRLSALDAELRAYFCLDAIDRVTFDAAQALHAAGWAGADVDELVATTRAILAV